MGGYVGKLQLGSDSQNQIAFGDLLYGVCKTSASAANKEIETADFPTFDRHIAGIQIRVKFTNGNTVTSNVKLKIKIGTDPVADDVIGDCTCDQNGVVTFTYDEWQNTVGGPLYHAWRVTGTNLTQSIKDYVDSQASGAISGIDSMIFKGTIGTTNANRTSLPNSGYTAGWTYKAITDDPINNFGLSTTIGFGQGKVEPGDLIIAIENAEDDQSTFQQSHWTVVQTNLDGTVTGPTVPAGTTITNQVAVFSDNTGKVINYSGHTIASDVPANAVFTDTNTSFQYRVINNTPVAVYNDCSVTDSGGTVLASVTNGVLKIERGITFTTTNVMPSGMALSETSVAGPSLTPSGT